MTTDSPLIDVVGATGASGSVAARIEISWDGELYPTSFRASTLNL